MAAGSSNDRITVPSNPVAPLPEDLRVDITTLLQSQQKVRELQSTLSTSCASAGWQSKVEDRVLQLLRNDEVRSYMELERVIVGEALGKDLLDEEAREEMEERNKDGKADAGKAVDIKLPESTVEAGTKVVRDVLDRSVDVKEEPVEDTEWKDWR